MSDEYMQAQVSALKFILLATLHALKEQDPNLVLRIVKALPTPAPPDTTPLNPSFETVLIETNKIIDELRDSSESLTVR